MTVEDRRLSDAEARRVDWRHWGPYLAERAWGTVREDYSEDGDAWRYFPHDHARSRAYRLNEDAPHWRDHLLFYEFFHGDDGRGLGASHQTGWTALVAKLLQDEVSPERPS